MPLLTVCWFRPSKNTRKTNIMIVESLEELLNIVGTARKKDLPVLSEDDQYKKRLGFRVDGEMFEISLVNLKKTCDGVSNDTAKLFDIHPDKIQDMMKRPSTRQVLSGEYSSVEERAEIFEENRLEEDRLQEEARVCAETLNPEED